MAFTPSVIQLKEWGDKVWFIEIAPPHPRSKRRIVARTYGRDGRPISFKSAELAEEWLAENKDWIKKAPKSPLAANPPKAK